MEIFLRFVRLFIRTLRWYGFSPLSMPIWVFWTRPFKKQCVAYYIIIFLSTYRLNIPTWLSTVWKCKETRNDYVRVLIGCCMLCSIVINGFRCQWLPIRSHETWPDLEPRSQHFNYKNGYIHNSEKYIINKTDKHKRNNGFHQCWGYKGCDCSLFSDYQSPFKLGSQSWVEVAARNASH